MAAVRFQLGLAGTLGANRALAAGARLAFQMGPHARQPGQQILVLGQLHLKPAFLRLGPLGKNIQNEAAAVQHLDPQCLRQHPHLGGGQVVIENDHGSPMATAEFPDLLHFALADEGAGVRRGAVLQHHAHGLGTGGLHQGGKLLHGALVGVFLFFQYRRVQPHQHHLISDFFCVPHKTPYF